MKISKEEFPKHLSAYTEDEKFYRDVYLHEKEHPETFKEYLDTLDPEYISRHRLYVPCIEYLAHEKYHSAFLNALLMQLWAMLLRYHENDIESILTRAYDGSPITEILNYISRSYQTATLHETAEHFMRMFKKTYGMTPGEYRKSSR